MLADGVICLGNAELVGVELLELDDGQVSFRALGSTCGQDAWKLWQTAVCWLSH